MKGEILHFRFWQYSVVMLIMLAVCACRNNKEIKENPEQPQTQTVDSIPQGTFSLKGKIGDFKVGMKIKVDGNDVTGAYYYYSQLEKKVFLTLNGKIDEKSNMKLSEFAPDGEKTGAFKGHFDGSEYAGTFTNFNSDKTYNFALSIDADQIEEVPRSLNEKAGRELLAKLSDYVRKDIPCKYFIMDVMGDDIPELWVRTGSSDNDYVLHVFSYTEEDGLKEIYKEPAGHTRYFEGFFRVEALRVVKGETLYYSIDYDSDEETLVASPNDSYDDEYDGEIEEPDADEINFLDADYVQPILNYLELDIKTL